MNIGERGRMTCAEFQRVLPEIIEGDRNPDQEAHLRSCPMCSELVSDLNAISDTARLLRGSEEPSPRVWNSIEVVLRKEGLIRQPQRDLVLVPARPWSPGRWLVPALATLALVTGIALYQRRGVQPTAAPPSQIAQQRAASPPNDKDEELVELVSSRTPAMRETYESNLRNVNAYIQDAEQSVKTDPNDEDARQSLMDAYDQKSALYEMAMDRSLP